ncbi:MAG: SusC/RagA family TonB-linked outer membrane protein, partial [Bacteroidales bacterium]|nr:SusC/RagA family TonB-linked outer membrane protein [Bacteroidales bacterium]
ANVTFLKSKILSLPEQNRKEGIIDGTKRYVEGGDRYAYWLYKFAGVDQMTGQSLYLFDDEKYYITSDNTADGTVLYGSAKNADGNANTLMAENNYIIINDTPYVYNPASYGKKDWCGTATPTAFGSFGFNLGWKGLSLSSVFTYSLGAKIYDGIYANLMNVSSAVSSVHSDVINAWNGIPNGMTETSADRINPNGIPMINGAKSYNNAGTTDRWLISGNYLVLKNVAISYAFPKRWVNALEMDGINLTVSCENAFTLTHRQGMNPQYSFSGTQSSNALVTPRVFTAGLTFKF